MNVPAKTQQLLSKTFFHSTTFILYEETCKTFELNHLTIARMLLDDRRFRDLILEMRRRIARIRIKLLIAIPVDRLRLRALQLLLLLTQARFAHHFVALLVYEQFALNALESLPSETPDSILAIRAKRPLQEARIKNLLYHITSSLDLLRWKCVKSHFSIKIVKNN